MLTSKKIRRLWEMDLTEIRFRLSQRVRIARESSPLIGGHSPRPEWSTLWTTALVEDSRLRHALEFHDDGAAAELLPPYLAERLIERFYPFITAPQDLVETFHQLFPGRVEQIIDEADRLRKHRMRIFAYPEMEYGMPPPWRTDLIHGIESGLEHWSQIHILDFS